MSARRHCCALAGALLSLALAGPAAGAEPEAAATRSERTLEQAPASFRDWVESLPEARRRPLLRRLADMPSQRRSRVFARWEALEEGERRELQALLEERADAAPEFRRRLEQLPPESREKLAPLVRRWRGMEPAERRRMRQRLERFRTLSPEDQEALIEKRFEARSPEERARILQALREASRALPERPLPEAPPEPPIAPAPRAD